jgi:hypothetical protein
VRRRTPGTGAVVTELSSKSLTSGKLGTEFAFQNELREYAGQLLATVVPPRPESEDGQQPSSAYSSSSFETERSQVLVEDEPVAGSREAVEILTRNLKKGIKNASHYSPCILKIHYSIV